MDRKRRIILTILAAIGLILSLELIFIFAKNNFGLNAAPSFCSVSQLIDCDGVSKTSYSMVFGIPLALWGTFLYILILFLTFVDKIRNKFPNSIFKVFKNPTSYIATIGLISFICSISLASISIFEIKKICVLCFVTYFIDLFIALCAKSKGSFFISDVKSTILDFFNGVKSYTILFLIVLMSAIGLFYYTQTSLVLSPYAKNQKDIGVFMEMKTNPYAISGNILGDESGKIKIQLFSDFLCPFCKVTNTMAHKLAGDIKDVEIIHQNFPLDTTCNPYVANTVHTGACMLAKYALAAEEQGNYWGLANKIYDTYPENEEAILTLAKSIGLDTSKLKADAHSNKIERVLNGQIEIAYANGVVGTPTTIISGIIYPGGMPYSQFVLKVKQAQKRLKRDGRI